MARLLASLFSGLLFGLGLAVAGMTDPRKVLGFLDLAGDWDPSLLFVLGGAVGVTMIAFRFVLRRPRPVLAAHFETPTRHGIDRPLLLGAALFGSGWGIAGYCPGPAVTLLALPQNPETWLVLPAILAGQWLYRRLTVHPHP